MDFNTVFSSTGDGTITLRLPVNIGNISLCSSTALKPGDKIARFDVDEYTGHDLDIFKQPEGYYEITAIY